MMVSYLILVVTVLIICFSCVADKVFPLVLRLFQIRGRLQLAAYVVGAVFVNAAQVFLSGGRCAPLLLIVSALSEGGVLGHLGS